MEQMDCYPDELPGEEFPCPESKQKDCYPDEEFLPVQLASSALHLQVLHLQQALRLQARQALQLGLA
jgi:hypothetical protein